MQSKHLLGALLLLLSTTGFISCSDDDESDYHLKLSENSCEVMQGRSVTIGLTAHENTTLNIESPELIEAVYVWESGSNASKIEITGKLTGETSIIVTDLETRESATIKVKVTEYPMPLLGVKQAKGNVFDRMDFYLYTQESQSINFVELSAVCDSMVWTADGLKGSFRVFEHKKGGSYHLTTEWGHCFLYTGEYKTYLTAWKDNKVVYRYQLDVPVIDNKDFLAYNWSDITKDSQAWTSYADMLGSSPYLMTSYGLNGNIPHVKVRLFGSDFAQSYTALNDYFRKLYSDPTYEDNTEKQKMWKLFAQLFSEQNKYSDAYPIAIWVTERANIVLLLLDESMDDPGYVVYAEPHRKN